MEINGEIVEVAYGTVDLERTIVHNVPIVPQNVCACIDEFEVKYGGFDVPVPSKYMKTLASAAGSFLQWPRELVIPKEVGKKVSSNDEWSHYIPIDPNPSNPNSSNHIPRIRMPQLQIPKIQNPQI